MRGLSVVMPLYNAQAYLAAVLPPLVRAVADRRVSEVLVVDDSSTDGSAALCRQAGFVVLSSGGRLGPGGCRNLGAKAAREELILFLDSDVVMHDDVPEKVLRVFDEHPDCVAVFGSYDDEPAASGTVSQYRNLLHHFVHQKGREQASTFWAGCGAVRRAAYLEVGGFNEQRYGLPSIEDIELGQRLLERGRILLRHDLQGKHLKRWTLRSMVHTDVFKRAMPWSRLLLRSGFRTDDLNVSRTERARALVALAFCAALLLLPFAPLLVGAVVLALGLLAFHVNREFFGLVRRKRGVGTMLAAVLLHQLYYLYSTLAFLYCWLEYRLEARPGAPAVRRG